MQGSRSLLQGGPLAGELGEPVLACLQSRTHPDQGLIEIGGCMIHGHVGREGQSLCLRVVLEPPVAARAATHRIGRCLLCLVVSEVGPKGVPSLDL
ncbi:hypothetical protein [Streptomyces sp. NPDC050564]|uniref:hypothetical protein n=1 Tax=Streptomyces sp. NPDC050564 TaxID=3365631 RepID=UPI0037AFF6E7